MKLSMETDSKTPMRTTLGVSLLACYIMFRYMTGSFDLYILSGTVLILMMGRKQRMYLDVSDYFWIVYVLIVFFFGIIRDDTVVTIKRMILLSVLILLKIILQTGHNRWSKLFLDSLFALGFIHVVSIVIEITNPSFIRVVKNLLRVSDREHRAAYLNGITPQPAIVGFCISVFSCICVICVLRSEKTRVKYLLLSLFGVATLLLTGKRALFVEVVFCCFVLTYLYYAVIMKKSFQLFTIILIVLILIPFLMRLSVFSRNIDRLLYGDDAGRFLIWEVLIKNFKSSPLIGVGRNAYYSQMDIGAHNEYLRVLSENGLFGFVFFFLALMIPLIKTLCCIFVNRNAIRTLLFSDEKFIVLELLTSIFWQLLILLYALSGNPLTSSEQLCSYMAFTAMGLSAKTKLEHVITASKVDNP
ncbi:MAG: O-antigen ligase family protein [Eubacterium sp.]|nr:O-antigen ligase family protein [Eubacterium sp.]